MDHLTGGQLALLSIGAFAAWFFVLRPIYQFITQGLMGTNGKESDNSDGSWS